MSTSDKLLQVERLSVSFPQHGVNFFAVKDISFTVDRGETLCLVGPSGCGKSVTAAALLGLLPGGSGAAVTGRICWNGVDYAQASSRAFDAVRGATAALIQQEPMAALDPVRTIGWQVDEVLRAHSALNRAQRRKNVIALLAEAGLPDPAVQAGRYPHQLSGGMCQRAMIAMALASSPSLLIADEPTTALDATIQAQILELLHRERERRGMALLLITHDMGVVARMADRVAVMSEGSLVECADVRTLFSAPRHPVTRQLILCAQGKGKSLDR